MMTVVLQRILEFDGNGKFITELATYVLDSHVFDMRCSFDDRYVYICSVDCIRRFDTICRGGMNVFRTEKFIQRLLFDHRGFIYAFPEFESVIQLYESSAFDRYVTLGSPEPSPSDTHDVGKDARVELATISHKREFIYMMCAYLQDRVTSNDIRILSITHPSPIQLT